MTVAGSNSAASTQATLVDELTKLAALHQQGALSEAEFAAAKQAAIQRYGM